MVQPDTEPALTYGDGTTADATKELDAVILASARGVPWVASTAFTYGQTVFPVARMGRRFKVITPGTSGATEPTWPAYDYGRVTSGTVELEEDGPDGASLYDLRRAKFDALMLHHTKAIENVDFNADGADFKASQAATAWLRLAQRYAPVGVS